MAHPGLLSIRRVLGPRPADDRCGLCGAPLEWGGHRHVLRVDPDAIDLQCACVPCHLLFAAVGAGGGRWRAVPDRWVALDGGVADWEQLDVPVGVAFFVVDSRLGAVRAGYPGPAGVTESTLPLAGWDRVVAGLPVVGSMEADVEGVLVRSGGTAPEAYLVPVAACFELAGRLRHGWHGWSGGPQGREVLAEFFAAVRARASGGEPAASARRGGADPTPTG